MYDLSFTLHKLLQKDLPLPGGNKTGYNQRFRLSMALPYTQWFAKLFYATFRKVPLAFELMAKFAFSHTLWGSGFSSSSLLR